MLRDQLQRVPGIVLTDAGDQLCGLVTFTVVRLCWPGVESSWHHGVQVRDADCLHAV